MIGYLNKKHFKLPARKWENILIFSNTKLSWGSDWFYSNARVQKPLIPVYNDSSQSVYTQSLSLIQNLDRN